MKKDFPLIIVTWIDAVAGCGWEEFNDVDNSPHIISTVGYLIKESKESILLVMSKDEQSSNFNCSFVIPKGMIQNIKKLVCKK